MADQKIKIGTTLGDAMNFTLGNFAKIFGMTWLSVVVIIVVALGGIFWILGFDTELLAEIGATFESSEFPYSWEGIETEATGSNGETGEAGKPDNDKQSPEDAAEAEVLFPDLTKILEGIDPVRMLIGFPAIVLALLVLQSVPIVGYTRMQLRGKAPFLWPFYFRLGPTEIRLTITLFLVSLIMVVAVLMAMVPLFVIFGTSQAAIETSEELDPNLVVALIVGAFLFFLVFIPWLWSRLAMAVPICVKEGGLGIRRAWRRSSGHGFTLTVSFIVGLLLVVAVSIVAQIVISIVTLPFEMAGEAILELELAMILIIGAPTLIALVAIQAFQNAFLYGLFTGAYKRLNGGPSD